MASMLDIMMGGQSGASSGWARGGEALGAAMGGGAGQRAYDDAMLRGHRVQKALKDAQKATHEYQSRIELEEALSDTFGPELARAAAATSNAGGNFSQLAQGRQRMIQGDALSAAMEGVQGGASIADVNPLLAINRGQPVQTTKVEGNTIISPFEAMSGQTPQVSPYGAGTLANNAARVSGQNAAAMARANAPRATSGGGSADAAAVKEYERVRKQAAQQILTDAKLADNDVAGLALADIISQMENGGVVRDREGKVIGNWDVSLDSFVNPVQQQDFSNVRGSARDLVPSSAMSGATQPATGVSTAAPGAAVTAPQTRATASSPMDVVLGPSIADIVLEGQPSAAAAGTMAPARPRSKAEYDALPSGTRFIAPDGTERIKP